MLLLWAVHSTGSNVVRIEAEALRALADRIAGPMAAAFEQAVDSLHLCTGRVIVTGMGKSGIIARKIAATLSSTGTPSVYLHPADAQHGDLGLLVKGDVVLALSASGETEEILSLLATIRRIGIRLMSITGDSLYPPNGKRSTLAQAADLALDCSIAKEACSMGLAPTASTTAMLALGDALAVALAEKRGFKEEDFANLHPGGKIGKKLARVSQLMHTGETVPRVSPQTQMPEVIYEMSRKGLGITTVVEGGKLLGVISDGDLRRLLERQKDVLHLTAAECMTRNPETISSGEFAAQALHRMEERKITCLVVTGADGTVEGMIHLHDLWGTQML
ncbi:MAG TPA: KpsF/GutQ family sugar-phosphate isomerase [Candidatus Angelobacter sp.]|nr:KpsF/GutQ family sugar-phosphate isomerase [Candidatus Angelobacter sp.]